MKNGILKTYKSGKRIICYITFFNGTFSTCTGKPSDAECICWKYDNLEEAKKTANEYFLNRTQKLL